MARTITGLSVRDIRTPTSRTLAGSDAVHTDPDYSATYVVLSTDARDGLEGHGMTFTLGRGNEVVRRGGPRAAASRRRLEVRRHRRRPRRLLGAAYVRESASMDRSGERRDPSRDGGDRKCGLGSLRQSRAQAGVETRRRHDARAVRRMHRLPLSHRRAHSRRRARHPARANSRRAANAKRRCARTATRPTSRPPDGWVIPTTRFAGCAARRSPPDGPASK